MLRYKIQGALVCATPTRVIRNSSSTPQALSEKFTVKDPVCEDSLPARSMTHRFVCLAPIQRAFVSKNRILRAGLFAVKCHGGPVVKQLVAAISSVRWWAAAIFSGSLAIAEVPVSRNDTILFYGNSLVERLLENGELEAYLQLANAGKDLRVRSLAWTGDEVGYRLRPDGFTEHLKLLLAKWPANIVVIGFGMNESFAGKGGLTEFRIQLEIYRREMARRHPGAKLVMLSPIAVQSGGPSDADARNRDIADYVDVMAAQAKAGNALFVDLFSASRAAYARSPATLTAQGIHLNERGNSEMAKIIARVLLGDAALARVDIARVGEVAKAASRKSHDVAAVVRIKNAVLYYGQRRRPEEYAAELPRYFQVIEQAERTLHALVNRPTTRFADYPVPSLPSMLSRPANFIPAGSDKGDNRRGATQAVVKSPAEQQKEFTVADGYTLNLFASEAEFPDLKNPIQMAFDARGRLWVATMPSFPLTQPGLPPSDKVIILEDTDHDGKADKCTVFADGFDVLDGLIFHELGVIVSAQPRLWILEDTDGDDRADRRTELLRGVDVSDTHHGGMISTDPAGHIFFSDGVFNRSQFETPFGVVRGVDATTYRLDPATGRIETEWQSLTPNPWKVAFDRYGSIFQRTGGGDLKDGLQHTWTPLGVYHPHTYGTILNYNKGPSISVVSSANFPDDYQGALASAALLGNYTVSLTKTGIETGPVVAKNRFDVISSKNPVFRPVDIEFGMDGAMYVADFCSVLIGQGPNPTRDLLWNTEYGRIWRVVYNGKPVVKDWPKIEGANLNQLLELLKHPQDAVRKHARLRLRGLGPEVIPALDAWIASQDRSQATFDQSMLEASWIFQAKHQARPGLIAGLIASKDPLYRVAAVQSIRSQFDQLPEAPAMLATVAQDAHPRVRMAVINVVSHLRPAHPEVESVIANLQATDGPLAEMRASLKTGTRVAKSRSIPVLEISPETQVRQWLISTAAASAETPPPPAAVKAVKSTKAAPALVTKTYRTFIDASTAQTALLSVKYGFLDIYLNGTQILNVDWQYSLEHQVVLELQPGTNAVEIVFRRLRGEAPPVFIYDSLGQPLTGARVARDDGDLKLLASSWAEAHAADEGALRVQAVPNLMQFAPKELRVKAGKPVRIVFENPDLMPHNFVLIAPGSIDEVGLLADELATAPDGLAKHFVPNSRKILHATPLVNPKGRSELSFTAPTQPGTYPYICTFPGHWRMMRGVLIVE